MALVRWDPFRDLSTLQSEVNRLFTRATGGDAAERQSWIPAIDVVETDDAIVLTTRTARLDEVILQGEITFKAAMTPELMKGFSSSDSGVTMSKAAGRAMGQIFNRTNWRPSPCSSTTREVRAFPSNPPRTSRSQVS